MKSSTHRSAARGAVVGGCLAGLAAVFWAGSLRAGPPDADRYWELGAGYYTAIRSDNPTDEARWDWAVLSESNTGIRPRGKSGTDGQRSLPPTSPPPGWM